MDKTQIINQAAHAFAKELVDQGKLIEGGFAIFAAAVIPKDAPPVQLREMEMAFMAGADHLFSSILSVLGDEDEPTAADLRRIDQITKELAAWRSRVADRLQPSQGQA